MIKINERWSISTDPRNYILTETYWGEDKKTHERKKMSAVYGFYPDLQTVLKAIARQETMDVVANNDMTLREAIKMIEEIEQKVYDDFVIAGAD